MARIPFSELTPDKRINIDKSDYEFIKNDPDKIAIGLFEKGNGHVIKIKGNGNLKISSADDALFVIDSLTSLLSGK